MNIKSLSLIAMLVLSAEVLADVDVGFSPRGTAGQLALRTLNQAQVSLDLAAYSFTSKPVAEALLAARKRGVTVRVLADKKAAGDRYSAATFLANQGIAVRLNGRYAIQHNKFVLVDGQTLQTGSLNYTNGAISRNAENVIVIRGDKGVNRAYQQEFERLWAEGEDLKPSY